MPTIVQHYDKKTGKTRVYESTPHYDPVTPQSRPNLAKSTAQQADILKEQLDFAKSEAESIETQEKIFGHTRF